MKKGSLTINENEYPKEFIEQLDWYKEGLSLENKIHPTAIIGENVVLGKGNFIGAFCVIVGNTKIGNGNFFHSFCSIGTDPEHKEYWSKPNKGTIIGDNCTFREFITVNAGCENPTIIDNNVIMLRGSHVGHDSRIMDNVTLSCNVAIGGHSLIGIHVNMGLGSVCHQFSKIPPYCMIGMNSTFTKKLSLTASAFSTYVGSPAKLLGTNEYWARHFKKIEIEAITKSFTNL